MLETVHCLWPFTVLCNGFKAWMLSPGEFSRGKLGSVLLSAYAFFLTEGILLFHRALSLW